MANFEPLTANVAALCLLLHLGCFWPSTHASPLSEDAWPMLAHDPERSGATPTEIRPPFERKWYRLFADEGLVAGIQPIVAGRKVFVGTMAGVLHAIDSDTGKDLWSFKAAGAILHTCAAADRKVFFGNAEGKICAVNMTDGTLAWSVQTGSAVWNAPLVHRGVVIVGSRDGKLYAIDANRWPAALKPCPRFE